MLYTVCKKALGLRLSILAHERRSNSTGRGRSRRTGEDPGSAWRRGCRTCIILSVAACKSRTHARTHARTRETLRAHTHTRHTHTFIAPPYLEHLNTRSAFAAGGSENIEGVSTAVELRFSGLDPREDAVRARSCLRAHTVFYTVRVVRHQNTCGEASKTAHVMIPGLWGSCHRSDLPSGLCPLS